MLLNVDFDNRYKKVREKMELEEMEAVVATCYPAVVYLTGAFFTPYRPGVAVIVTKQEIQLIVRALDIDRLSHECHISNVKGYNPFFKPMEVLVVESIKELNVPVGKIGFEIPPEQTWGMWSPTSFKRIEESLSEYSLVDASKLFSEITIVKEEVEIQNLRQAAAICDIGFETSLDIIKPGISEREVAAEAEMAMKKAGADYFVVGATVASGFRAAYLDAGEPTCTSKIIQRGDIVHLDFTPVYNNYMGDALRMIAVGSPSSEQQKLADDVEEIFNYEIELIKPGVKISEVSRKVRELKKKKGYGERTTWHDGHGLGIPPRNIPHIEPTEDREFCENMCFAIVVQIHPPERVGGMGLESPVIIRKDGPEILTRTPNTLLKARNS